MKIAKLTFLLLPILAIGFAISFQSCVKDDCDATQIFIRYDPVYMTKAEIRQEINVESARTLENIGKLYFYDSYIFVNELREGVHVINNEDPYNPENVGFIKIPGNVDIAIKGDVLYADNYLDLVAIDISNLQNPTVVGTVEDVFDNYQYDDARGYLVYWEQTSETMEVDCSDPRWGGNNWFWMEGDILLFDANVSGPPRVGGAEFLSNQSGAPGGITGVGGSMARFTIYTNYLYTVDETKLNVFDITTLSLPQLRNTVDIGWGIETIFPYGDKLFIGSRTGMYIFDNSDPVNPTQLSIFSHLMSCDPVVVEGNTAYVTLRGGTNCRQDFTNQLDILDISDLTNPELIKTYPMENPHGLAVRDKKLYLCDGLDGLKVFNVEDPLDIEKLDQEKDVSPAYDAISLSDSHLLVIGQNGLFQYDTSDKEDLKQMSSILIK